MSDLNKKRSEYSRAKKEMDSSEAKANEAFELAFPKGSEVLFKRQTDGRLYRGIVLRVYACGSHRKVRVTNYDTGGKYWVDSSWLHIDEIKKYDYAL